jgi:hypothetical protein
VLSSAPSNNTVSGTAASGTAASAAGTRTGGTACRSSQCRDGASPWAPPPASSAADSAADHHVTPVQPDATDAHAVAAMRPSMEPPPTRPSMAAPGQLASTLARVDGGGGGRAAPRPQYATSIMRDAKQWSVHRGAPGTQRDGSSAVDGCTTSSVGSTCSRKAAAAAAAVGAWDGNSAQGLAPANSVRCGGARKSTRGRGGGSTGAWHTAPAAAAAPTSTVAVATAVSHDADGGAVRESRWLAVAGPARLSPAPQGSGVHSVKAAAADTPTHASTRSTKAAARDTTRASPCKPQQQAASQQHTGG